MENIQQRFDKADSVIRANILELLERSEAGVSKYGTTLDRQDLNLSDWLQHALEETLDNANYLKAALNKLEQPGENTQNATQVNLPSRANAIFEAHADDLLAFRQFVRSCWVRNPHLWKMVRVNLELCETDDYLKSPNLTPSPDFMLEMVTTVNNSEAPGEEPAIVRLMNQSGMFGKVTSKDVTPKN